MYLVKLAECECMVSMCKKTESWQTCVLVYKTCRVLRLPTDVVLSMRPWAMFCSHRVWSCVYGNKVRKDSPSNTLPCKHLACIVMSTLAHKKSKQMVLMLLNAPWPPASFTCSNVQKTKLVIVVEKQQPFENHYLETFSKHKILLQIYIAFAFPQAAVLSRH